MVITKHQEDVAVFFDYENIVFSLKNLTGKKVNFDLLMAKCQEYGRVVIANAYADWGNYGILVAPIKSAGFDPVHVTTFAYSPKNGKKTTKNAVDIHMAIDAIDVLHLQSQIQQFILITGDKDFVPVAKMLRKYGKKVIAFGVEGTTSAHMQSAVDEFGYYSDLEKSGWKNQNVNDVLVEVVKRLNKEKLRPIFPRVKDGLLELIPGFDEKNYEDKQGKPFIRFKDFILEAEAQGYVKFYSRDMVNEVLLPDAKIKPQIKLPSLMSLDDAFDLLVKAVDAGVSRGKSLRSASIKNTMRRMHPGFDEKEIKNETGKFFVNFSDFARAARKRGLVELAGSGIYLEIKPVTAPEIQAEKPPESVAAAPIETTHPKTEPAVSPNRISSALDRMLDLDDSLAPPLPPNPEKELIVDALRQLGGPAPAQDFGTVCQNMRDDRNLNLPNRRISQMLTVANQAGIIQQSADTPGEFVFVDEAEKIAKFLNS
jgi:uncharacterized protein (TIGR00288 family)